MPWKACLRETEQYGRLQESFPSARMSGSQSLWFCMSHRVALQQGPPNRHRCKRPCDTGKFTRRHMVTLPEKTVNSLIRWCSLYLPNPTIWVKRPKLSKALDQTSRCIHERDVDNPYFGKCPQCIGNFLPTPGFILRKWVYVQSGLSWSEESTTRRLESSSSKFKHDSCGVSMLKNKSDIVKHDRVWQIQIHHMCSNLSTPFGTLHSRDKMEKWLVHLA